MKIKLQPAVLKWARERARLDEAQLAKKLAIQEQSVKKWERTGELSDSAAKRLAKKTHTPFGYLFLPQPLDEKLPISDFRRAGTAFGRPSPELLDVLYHAQRRQNWYRDYLIDSGEEPLDFVGRATLQTPHAETANDIRKTLGIGSALTLACANWEEAMRYHIEAIEDAGILVIRTGVAEGNTHRKLSVDEFRGFALSDKFAPLIFINGADAHTAQMFTLAHEVAHIWIGESAVSNLERTYATAHSVEAFCNSVAAEVLLPLSEIKSEWVRSNDPYREIVRISHKYRISRIVVARRAHDAGFISNQRYVDLYRSEIAASTPKGKGGGGNYYLNEQFLNSRRFSAAIIRDAKEGRTLYQDAMNLLGIKKEQTFRKFAESLQITT